MPLQHDNQVWSPKRREGGAPVAFLTLSDFSRLVTSAPPRNDATMRFVGTSPRLAAVDCVRGLVMVLMALDHTRGMVSGAQADPTNLAETSAALFLTRWITHFCAPIFVFLAGTGAFLSRARGKSRSELANFLWTRGVWLIFLEFTLVRLGWSFRLASPFLVGQVIWALGCSMIALSALVYLPPSVIGLFGVLMIALHNLLDDVRAETFGSWSWLWGILHGGANLRLSAGLEFRPSYALIPWVGVMAAGYGFGPLLLGERDDRQRKLIRLGILLSALFLVIRAIDSYGDPRPWAVQNSALFTVFSFVNCTKYPPSLLFLLMTLGPAIIGLGLLDRALTEPLQQGNAHSPSAPLATQMHVTVHGARALPPINERATQVHRKAKHGEQACSAESSRRRQRFYSREASVVNPLIVFGRVPLFYYLLHLPLIHLLAVLASLPHARVALGSFYYARPPAESGYGHDLWVVYLLWITAVLLLYPLCRWFAQIKERSHSRWLSYL
jgi:uncharacterized membrane protein